MIISFGLCVCIDAFLFFFTFLPVRLAAAVVLFRQRRAVGQVCCLQCLTCSSLLNNVSIALGQH